MRMRNVPRAVFGVGLAVLLGAATAGQAQDEKTDQGAKAEKKTPGGSKAEKKSPEGKKGSAEAEKAKAEVKELHAEMAKLKEQMRDTAKKLMKAYAALGKDGEKHGPDGRWGKHDGGRHGKGWGPPQRFGGRGGMWGRPHGHGRHYSGGPAHRWGSPWAWGRGGAWGHAGSGAWAGRGSHRPGPGAGGSADVERRLDRLQREVEELRKELRGQKK